MLPLAVMGIRVLPVLDDFCDLEGQFPDQAWQVRIDRRSISVSPRSVSPGSLPRALRLPQADRTPVMLPGWGRTIPSLLSAARCRAAVEHVTAQLGVSQRLACRVLEQHRSTQPKVPRKADDEAALTQAIVALATQHGRYG